jgi:transcriptional regulator with XRE-family HTH domain
MYEVFEQLLHDFGISTYKFCRDTEIPQSTISTWKKKRNLISADIAKIIAEYFNISIDFLMSGEERKEEGSTDLTDEELRRLQILKVNDKLRILFDETQGLSSSDIDFVLAMVEKLKK